METLMKARKNKDKNEIIDELQQKKELASKKVLVKTMIFPSLHDSCKTIADAKVLLEFTTSMITKIGMDRMYKTKMKEIDLVSLMTDDSKSDKYKGFFSSLQNLDIGDTITLLDQLKSGINNYVENKVDSAPLTEADIEAIIPE